LLGNVRMEQYRNCHDTRCEAYSRSALPMERLGKHVSAETNSRNNRRAVFSVRSVPRGYKKDKEDCLSQSSFETPACTI
jgi:hypothetical protein